MPRPYLPFAEGIFPTPSGKCELYSQRLADMGLDPVPTFTPPYESAGSSPELASRFPLALISSPAHQFLNSSFVNVETLRRSAHEPELVIHPEDATQRSRAQRNARGSAQRSRGASARWPASRTP